MSMDKKTIKTLREMDSQSSHPIPPAPTNKTLVCGRRAHNSRPKIASTWAVRPECFDLLGLVLGFDMVVFFF